MYPNQARIELILGSILAVFCFLVPILVLIQGKAATPVVRPVISSGTVTSEAPAAVLPVVMKEASQATSPKAERYLVRQGDTLSKIAVRFCTDYLTIAREHQITPPYRIYAGKTTLSLKNGCARNTPPVLAKRSVSPGEFARNGGASREKHSPPELVPAQPGSPSATQEVNSDALSVVRRSEIRRIAQLRSIEFYDRTPEQRAELQRLTGLIRQEVLARYPLKNPGCLYAHASEKTWEARVLSRIHCIRENYGEALEQANACKLAKGLSAAVVYVESRGQPDAISLEGNVGVSQFTANSARRFHLKDRLDPKASIQAGQRHLCDNLRMWNGNVVKALVHYNKGIVAARNAEKLADDRYATHVFQVWAVIKRSGYQG